MHGCHYSWLARQPLMHPFHPKGRGAYITGLRYLLYALPKR